MINLAPLNRQSLARQIIALDSLPTAKLATPTGRMINVYLAKTWEQQIQGLSFQKKLPDGQGMLFLYDRPGPRQFWMKDTYLSLDIYFLDGNLQILQVARQMPATPPGTLTDDKIANTGTIWSQVVLELKSSDPLNHLLEVGVTLKWISPSAPLAPSQTRLNIHHWQYALSDL